MKQKISVCFITEDFYPDFIGGQGIYGRFLIEELLKKDACITVLAENKKNRKRFWNKFPKLNLILVPFCFGNQLLLAFFEYAYFLLRCSSAYFDIVHANQLSAFFFVLWKPKNIGKVIVAVHHTNMEMYLETKSFKKKILYTLVLPFERYIYEHADGLIFPTGYEKIQTEKVYHIGKIPKQVIPYGVEPVSFTKIEKLRAKKTILRKFHLETENLILYVGRLVKRKRVDLILKALQHLRTRGEKLTGVIIGKGPEFSNLKQKYKRNARFLGFVENTKPYFLAADVFVNLSVAEGGVVLTSLEAASFGLPLILSKESADKNIVQNGINGYVINSNNPKEIAKNILNALKYQKKLGTNSKKLAKKQRWEKTTAKILNFYQKMQKV